MTLNRIKPKQVTTLVNLVRQYHAFEGLDDRQPVSGSELLPLLDEARDLGGSWFIEHEQQVIGYLIVCFGYSVEFHGRDAFLDEMFVIEPYRGRGFGKLALRQLRELLSAYDIKALHLEVGRENIRAQRLYQSVGFKARKKYFLMSVKL